MHTGSYFSFISAITSSGTMAPAINTCGPDAVAAATAAHGREKSRAAAWAWYERGALHTGFALSCTRQGSSCSTALMVRGKYMKSKAGTSSSSKQDNNDNDRSGSSVHLTPSKRSLPPSRFKREADALAACQGIQHHQQQEQQELLHGLHDAHDHHHASSAAQMVVSTSTASLHHAEEHVIDATSPSNHLSVLSDHCLYTQFSHRVPQLPAAALHPLAYDSPHHDSSPASSPMAYRKSDASAPFSHDCWLDKTFGISSRKSTSSLYMDHELLSLTSLFGGQSAGSKGLSSQRSSLFDSFELQSLLKSLVPQEHHHSPEVKDAQELAQQLNEEPHVSDAEEGSSLNDLATQADPHDSVEAHHQEIEGLANNYKPKEAHCPTSKLVNLISTSPNTIVPLLESSEAENAPSCQVSEIVPFRSSTAKNLSSNPVLENTPSSLMAENTSDITVIETAHYNYPMEDNTMGGSSSPSTMTAVPSHSKQTLQELLQWSARSSNTTSDCSCVNEDAGNSDHYYYSESPDFKLYMDSCNSSSCKAEGTRHHRRRRPSLLMPNLSHSFSNVLHHLPHSLTHALQHLPHSFSNALHRLPRLPHSLSNAVHHNIAHFRHLLSGAYKHPVASSGHSVEGSPCHDPIDRHASTPRHHHSPSHLRQFFSFKLHHSPSHSDVAYGSTSPSINYHGCTPPGSPTFVCHDAKASPTRERRLSASDEYMLIYSTTKKHRKKGVVHHHHHHHYHHYHYVV